MRKITLMLTLVIMMFAFTAHAQEMPVDEIINKANLASYYAGDDGKSDIHMSIVDSQARERIRDFRILRMDVKDGGEQKFFVYFKSPSDVSGMTYMVWKHIGRDDDRWLYLPALDLVRRIAASDKRSSFVGSHFVYEDVSGRGVDADEHTLVGEENGMYKIKNVPKDKDIVEFSYYFVWIDKNNFIPMKAEYYDDQDKLIRTVEALEVKDIQGNPTVVKSKATDIIRGGETTIDFSNIEYDIGLTDNIFKERYLRRPPVQWIE